LEQKFFVVTKVRKVENTNRNTMLWTPLKSNHLLPMRKRGGGGKSQLKKYKLLFNFRFSNFKFHFSFNKINSTPTQTYLFFNYWVQPQTQIMKYLEGLFKMTKIFPSRFNSTVKRKRPWDILDTFKSKKAKRRSKEKRKKREEI